MIKINDDLYLKCFDKENDMWFIDEIDNTSKSNFISKVKERLLLSRNTSDVDFSNAYLAVLNN